MLRFCCSSWPEEAEDWLGWAGWESDPRWPHSWQGRRAAGAPAEAAAAAPPPSLGFLERDPLQSPPTYARTHHPAPLPRCRSAAGSAVAVAPAFVAIIGPEQQPVAGQPASGG